MPVIVQPGLRKYGKAFTPPGPPPFTPHYLLLNFWYDSNDLATLFQTYTDPNTGDIPVTGINQPVGMVKNKGYGDGDPESSTNLLQATSTGRPLYTAMSSVLGFGSNTAKRIQFDLVDDIIAFDSVIGADYYWALNAPTGIQFFSIPPVFLGVHFVLDFIELFGRSTPFTPQEKTDITTWFNLSRAGIPVKDFLWECYKTPSNIPLGSINSGVATWLYGSGATFTGMGPHIQAVTPRESLTLDFSIDSGLNTLILTTSGNPAIVTGILPDLSPFTGVGVGGGLGWMELRNATLQGLIPTNLGVMPSINGFFIQDTYMFGLLPTVATNNLLQYYVIRNMFAYGSIPSLSGCPALLSCYVNNHYLTGNIPLLSSNTSMTDFVCNNNQITGWTGGTVSNTLGTFNASTNNLTVTAINAILAAFVLANRTTGTRILNIGGVGNAAPTGQGLTDKATLQGRGWTVTTN